MKTTLLILLFTLTFSCGPSSNDGNTSVSGVDEITISYMDKMNLHRQSKGARSLIFSDEVYKVSKEHSDYMASGPGRFSHAGFNERCNKLKAKIPNIKSCGEIIANGQKNEDEALNSWLKSPGHKAILEDPKYTHSALAYTKNQSGKFFWIQFFIEVD